MYKHAEPMSTDTHTHEIVPHLLINYVIYVIKYIIYNNVLISCRHFVRHWHGMCVSSDFFKLWIFLSLIRFQQIFFAFFERDLVLFFFSSFNFDFDIRFCALYSFIIITNNNEFEIFWVENWKRKKMCAHRSWTDLFVNNHRYAWNFQITHIRWN